MNKIFFRYALLSCCLAACGPVQKATKSVEEKQLPVTRVDSLPLGIAVYQASTVDYRRNGKTLYKLRFSEPYVVSVADRPYKWGYFQFPRIDRQKDGSIHVRWRLNDDAMEAYGSHKDGEAASTDGGKTFKVIESAYYPFTDVTLANGDRLSIHTPKPIPASSLQLPKAIGGSKDTYSQSSTQYFRMEDMPENARKIYFDRLPANSTTWQTESTTLKDPQAARYTLRGNVPIIWWGDMHTAKDKSLVAGVYPGFYVKPDGLADSFHHVFFYRSLDNGRNWDVQGRIFYTADLSVDPNGNKRMGYTEPAYEVLSDGSMLCVMRTTDGIGNGPMYASRSTDNGVTWTKPVVMAPSGVLPRLLQLQNGVLVLASGRPGVQLRFSYDGKGEAWSDPFEMLPWIDYKDQVSCGYTGLLPSGPDRFLLVYSDFRYVNEAGEVRKAIKVREVVVSPQTSKDELVKFNDPRLQYEGRITHDDEAAVLYWPGTTVTTRFNGTGIKAVMKDFNGQNYFNVIVDNKAPSRIRIDSVKKTYTLAENLANGTHTVTLYKITQAHVEYKRGYTRFFGFEMEAGSKLLSPPPYAKRAIEFYGNSITCGHGIYDSTGGDRGAGIFENNYISYGAITARHFNSRYRFIAKSGIGITVSYGSLIMPEMYDRTNPFDSTSKWDFSQYTPNIVVVNLFQNDRGIVNRPDYEHFIKRFGTKAPTPEFITSSYQKFIGQLRGKYPMAHIICALGSMDASAEGSVWREYVTTAVKNINDQKIYTHFFKYKGSPKHPLVKDHEVMAASLIGFIEKNIKW